MRQPDFQELFHSTFAKERGPIRYRLRADSNFRHDEVFMASLLRDALLRPGQMSCTKQTLEIPLIRERWELGHGLEMRSLVQIPAVLTISRVKRIEWIGTHLQLQHSLGDGPLIEGADEMRPDTECQIAHFSIRNEPRRDQDGDMHICIAGGPFNWKLHVAVSDPGWSVKLTDTQSASE